MLMSSRLCAKQWHGKTRCAMDRACAIDEIAALTKEMNAATG